MATKKTRVTLYLDGELYARARALVDSLPGASFSGVVAELLEDFLPVTEALLAAAKSGDKDAQAKVFSSLLADQFVKLADEGVATVRHVKKGGIKLP